MPSLRKRVSSYFRQLSFHNEPRDKRNNVNENSFVTKYLEGNITLKESPPIIYGKNPTDLPNYELLNYTSGFDTVIGCYSGPNGGLTTVKRIEKHLSVLEADIDFIDTPEEQTEEPPKPKKSPQRICGQPVDNTTMIIKVAGQEYCVTNETKRHNKSHSLGSLSEFNIEIEKTKIDKNGYNTINQKKSNKSKKTQSNIETTNNISSDNNSNDENIINNNSKIGVETADKSISEVRKSVKKQSDNTTAKQENLDKKSLPQHNLRKNEIKSQSQKRQTEEKSINTQNYGLAKSKSEGNPFQHRKKGKIIKIANRTTVGDSTSSDRAESIHIDDTFLPNEWNKKSEFVYGISDSLYDRNQVTKNKNGDPIADCFGVVARQDSAILAVADGVNWGEKACIAAKSAIHGCLYYLNKTIFSDTKLFDNLTIKSDNSNSLHVKKNENAITNTREVFVCLLRAFTSAHDLILENKGMLTTLTVAVVLPLKQSLKSGSGDSKSDNAQYVCCVCNVGDTLAYVYSQKYGMRELTKGSHDINCNRDMRDALGALGPVDGINPELSNLTLSITILQKGDIVFLASDGLTDNFDPNVSRFTVNSTVAAQAKAKKPTTPSNLNRTPSRITQTQIQPEAKSHIARSESLKSTSSSAQNLPPVKPPRRQNKNKHLHSLRNSADRSSITETSSSRSSQKSTISSSSGSNLQASSGKGTSKALSENIQNLNDNLNNPINKLSNSSNVSEETKKSEVDGSSVSNENKLLETHFDNPLIAEFMRENSLDESSKVDRKKLETSTVKKNTIENKTRSLQSHASNIKSSQTVIKKINKSNDNKKADTGSSTYKFLRSKTSLDFRISNTKQILRNDDGIPYVTPIQRYELQLLLMEDILRNGISGQDKPCTTAKKLCESLVSFTFSITSAKRHTLEDHDLYFDNRNGVLVEVNAQEKKLRRKKGLEKVQNLPGKLDHVTVVAFNVGNFAIQ